MGRTQEVIYNLPAGYVESMEANNEIELLLQANGVLGSCRAKFVGCRS